MIAVETKVTWDTLTELEPRLVALMERAKAVMADGPHFCANNAWYGYKNPRDLNVSIKRAFMDVIGWDRIHNSGNKETERILRGQRAYDIGYKAIYEKLPDCRDCGCMRMG